MKVTIQLEECNVIVTGEYIPAEFGERDSYGQKLEPDYPAEFLVEEFTLVYEIDMGPTELPFELHSDMLPVGLIDTRFYDEMEERVLEKLDKGDSYE